MSDYKSKRDQLSKLITTSNPDLRYLNKLQSSEEIVVAFTFPKVLLRKLISIVEDSAESFVQVFNHIIPGHCCQLRHSENLEKKISRACYNVRSSYHGMKSGSKRDEYDKSPYKMHFKRGDVVDTMSCLQKISDLEDENIRITKRCDELLGALCLALKQEKESRSQVQDLSKRLLSLEVENKRLRQFIDDIEKYGSPEDSADKPHLTCNSNKKPSEISARQRQRRIAGLKTNVKQALWFCRSFGFDVERLVLKDDTGKEVPVNFNAPSRKSYSQLSDAEKEKIETILFYMDKFCSGDAYYHELTMMCGDLPKSYLIKECRDSLNSMYAIERTPGKEPGVQVNFESELRRRAQELLEKSQPSTCSKLSVKVAGDGASMSRKSNFLIISFSLLNDEKSALSSKALHPLAVIKATESYQVLLISLKEVLGSINSVLNRGHISVGDKELPVEIFLGGDMKFLNLLMGLSNATSKYACLWCLVPDDMRHDVSKPIEFWNEGPNRRTLEKMREWAIQEKYSCKDLPLMNIEPDHIIPDELHLLLRISDVLVTNLVNYLVSLDKADAFNHSEQHPGRLKLLEQVVREDCCIAFSVWEKKNGDGSGSGLYHTTSLMGDDKKKLLRRLPVFFEKLMEVEKARKLSALWLEFVQLYEGLSAIDMEWCPADCFQKSRKWIEHFLLLTDVMPGFNKKKITPYMHVMCYHMPVFIEKFGNIKKFSGQPVEKKNDDARKIHRRKSNKHDACLDVMRACQRMSDLSARERVKREYSCEKIPKSKSVGEKLGNKVRTDTVSDCVIVDGKLITADSPAEVLVSCLKNMEVPTRGYRKPSKLFKILKEEVRKENINGEG